MTQISKITSSNIIDDQIEELNEKLKLVNVANYRRILKLELKEPGKENVLKTIRIIEKLPFVLAASPSTLDYPNSIQTNDTYFSEQWALTNIRMTEGWEFTTGNSSIKVGIIDSGIKHSHPEFINRVRNLPEDDIYGGTSTVDLHGHGTKVAGIIGASVNNGSGIAGACHNMTIIPLRVAGVDGTSTKQAAIDAIAYATTNDIPILNYSRGSYDYNLAFESAISQYNGLFICSAGNENYNTDLSGYVHYPSSYSSNNIISVGAHDRSNGWRYNYGKTTVDLAAPGYSVYTTTLEGYDERSGTSYAAPYVTGVAALIMSLPGGEDFTPVQIKNFILNGTEPVAGFEDKCVTGGKLNAYLAIRNAIDNGKNPVVAGDFDGDGVDELAGFYGRNNYTALIYWENLGNKFDIQAGTVACVLPDFAVSRISGQIAAGDFNGDGVDEIGALYDYDTYLGLWTFTRQSNGKFIQKKIGDTGAFNDEGIRNRVTCGDLDADGKDEMLALYYYSHSGNMGLWYFRPTATDTLELARAGLIYGLVPDCVDNRIAAGDFDGDGADEYGILYDHTTNYTEMILLDRASDGTFSHYTVGQTGTYNYEYTKGLISAGDYDGDGVDEMMTLYGYDLDVPHKALMKIWIFERLADGTMNLPRSDFYPTFYNPNIAYTMVTGKFSSATSRDTMAGIYDYGPYSKVWAFGYPAENTWTCTALV